MKRGVLLPHWEAEGLKEGTASVFRLVPTTACQWKRNGWTVTYLLAISGVAISSICRREATAYRMDVGTEP